MKWWDPTCFLSTFFGNWWFFSKKRCYFKVSARGSWSNYSDLTGVPHPKRIQKVAFWKGNPQKFQENPGGWNIVIWSDLMMFTKQSHFMLRSLGCDMPLLCVKRINRWCCSQNINSFGLWIPCLHPANLVVKGPVLNDRNRGGEQGKQRTAYHVTYGHMAADGKLPNSAFSFASKRSQMLPWDGTLNKQSHIHLI